VPRLQLTIGITVLLSLEALRPMRAAAQVIPAPLPAPRAYVTNRTTNDVSVVDTETNTVVATVPTGTTPFGVAISPKGDRAYVTNQGSDSVSVIDTATNDVVATVPLHVGSWPTGLAVTPDGTRVYVANHTNASFNPSTVSVIDTATNTVVATVGVGVEPWGVAITPDGKHAYVTNQNPGTVSVIRTDTNTVVATVPVGFFPQSIAITPDGSRAYVANFSGGTVSVIRTDLNTVMATVTIGGPPTYVAISPDGRRAYVSNVSANGIWVLDTNTNAVIAKVPGFAGFGLALTPDGSRAYVADGSFLFVRIIDTVTFATVGTVVAGGNPEGVAMTGPAISIEDVSVANGTSGTTAATFTVVLSAASARTITVDFATADGTASAGNDYVAQSGSLTFSPGEISQQITVLVNGNTTIGPDQTFFVNLSNPTNASLAKGQGVGTIINSNKSVPRLSIDDVSVGKPNSGTTNATFMVTLSAPAAQPVTVDFTTADGTAVAGSDYVASSGTLDIAAGETSKQIVVGILGGTPNASDKVFFVNLGNPVNSSLAKAQGVGTITSSGPVLDPLLDLTVAELTSIAFTAVAHDPGHTFTFTFGVPPPAGATLTTTGAFAWTPALGQAGTYSIAIKVTDERGLSDQKTLSIVVTPAPPPPPPPTLTSITVTPVNPTVVAGSTQLFKATGLFSDAAMKDLTASVTWGSQTPSAATITAGGLATGVDSGTSLISATSGTISGSTTLTVINPAKPIDYTMSVPPTLTLGASSTGTPTITLHSLNGIGETVDLSAGWVGTSIAAIPDGVDVAISPLHVSVPSTGSASSTVTVTTSNSTSFGTFTLRVVGTSITGVKRFVDLIVTIQSPSQHTCCMGDYVAPAPGVSIDAGDLGVSPGGAYEVVDAGGAPAGLSNLIVRRTSDQHVVLPNIQAAFWGFSPDGDRFVTHWVQDPGGASIDQVALYDLTSANPASPIWSGSDSTHSSRLQFSPSGHYFFYTDVFNGQTQLTLIDAHTGTKEFTQSISQSAGAPVAGQDSFGIIDWGFGPDDSRFVYAYVSEQTPQTDVEWNLVNLQTGPGHALVKTVSLIGETADYWLFSPCGDVIGLVHQPGQQGVQIDVYNTKDGSAAGSGAQIPNPVQLLELHATSTSQVATANGSTDYTMGANIAPCPTLAPPPPPSSGCCTGPYVDAAQGVAIANKAGASPSGKYLVESSAGAAGLANLTVRRSSDQQIVLTGIQAAFWGFSPDDDRFVTHWGDQSGGTSTDHVGLYDLTSANPTSPIWPDPMASTLSSRILFSASGHYLLYAYVGGDVKTHLALVDARTGTVAFTDDSIPSLAGPPVPGQDSFGTIGWGFIPNDNRFVYGFLSASNVTQVNLVNLQTKGVKSISLIGETGDFWQFSPCGDILALVHQLGQQGVGIDVYNTRDGTSAGPGARIPAPIQSLQLHATSTLQVATNGSLDYTLAANNAPCPASFSAHSPVNILVVDDQGRRSGFDPATGTVINEIPGASYTGVGTEPQTVTVPFAVGTYVLNAYGLDSLMSPEPYRLTVETGSDSNLSDLHELSGIASRGSSQQFVVLFGDHGTITTFAAVDTTPPVITPSVSGTLGNNGWYTSDVSVSWSVTDAQSPIRSTSGCSPVSVTSDTAGATFTCMATSAGGTASSSVTIKRDGTAPSIVVTTPAGTYMVGQTVAANYSCSDGGSGVASCGGTVPNGTNLNTAVAGPNTVTVNATDRAGNSNVSVASYTVVFNVCSLYDSNLAKKIGSAYPIKLQLCDAAGHNLSSSSIVVHAVGVTRVSSSTAAALDDTGNANADLDFRYDAALGGYIFNLSTNGYLTGTYRLNFTAGSDPTVHSALFAVK